MKNISFDALIDYLNHLPREPIYIKFFSEAEHAEQFAKGQVCLGTLAYYRSMTETDGRADASDGKLVANGVGGEEIALDSGITYIDRTPAHQGVPMRVESILRGLSLCFFEYKKNTESNRNLKKSIASLGNYLCILDETAMRQLNTINYHFIRSLDGTSAIPSIFRVTGRKVKYVSNPDSGGFQKMDLPIYKQQQEYRFLFSFTDASHSINEVGELSARFIMQCENNFEAQCFHIIPD